MKRYIRYIKCTSNNKIPYDLVSMAAIIRDFDKPEYKSEVHRLLTNIADTLYNIGLGPEYMKETYKDLYYQYGKEYWDKVIADMSAIDSQLTSQTKKEELLADYNDRIGITASTKVIASELISTDGPAQLAKVVDLLDATDGFNIDDIDGNDIYYSVDYNTISKEEAEDVLNEIDMTTVYGSTKITASAWVAPNGKKYGKQTHRFPGKYLFTRRELKSMIDEGVANKLDVDINRINYDIIGISWNDTNGHRSGILIKDRDSGELFVGNTADANVARLS